MCVRMSETVFMCVRMSETVFMCIRMSETVFMCVCMSETVFVKALLYGGLTVTLATHPLPPCRNTDSCL